jgi:hypothetical protein
MSWGAYLQPGTLNLPASRSFVIGPDQSVFLPVFGHDPTRIIGSIYGLLGHIGADLDADGEVDTDDFDRFSFCFTGPGGYPAPGCAPADFDGDQDVDCRDWYSFAEAWSGLSDPPAFGACSEAIDLSVDRSRLEWTAVDGADTYDVVWGDLDTLRHGDGDYTGAVGGCVVDDLADFEVPFAVEPTPGSAWWLLVRGTSGTSHLSYDNQVGSQFGNRDAGIDASGDACP